MQGVSFVVDESGKKSAVMIDVKMHGDLIDDMLDAMVVELRRKEPKTPLSTVKKRLLAKRK